MKVLLTLSLLFIGGCSSDIESPKETYDKYVQLEIAGISVEQFLSSYSQRKLAEIEIAVNLEVEKNSLSREQTFERLFPLFQTLAKCKKLEFLDEEIDGNNATVYYKATDDCMQGHINIKKEIIYMVYEDNGWKIDNNDIQEL